MDYTNDFQRFEYLVETQAAAVGGRIPLYPGLGVTAGSSSLGSDDTIAQILIARRLGVPGFILFNYSQSWLRRCCSICRADHFGHRVGLSERSLVGI
jgi:hypothetical protein